MYLVVSINADGKAASAAFNYEYDAFFKYNLLPADRFKAIFTGGKILVMSIPT